ncbi:DUF6912 family protein [Actinomyces vulturis]|uniref:DUF6912 family protein n=1 Tax=Actinomyces vulturis TaxID=1857645 RepID=UPI00082C94ED|nr:hypothetical protein [Actinomyces vulturis]
MRIYLPVTIAQLRETRLDTTTAFGPTTMLRHILEDYDDEEIEASAFLQAAHAAVDVIAKERTTVMSNHPAVRIVVAADAPDSTVSETPTEEYPGLVELNQPVAWKNSAAIFIDEPGARDLCERALNGDEEARDELDDRDLLWYDLTERDEVLALIGE